MKPLGFFISLLVHLVCFMLLMTVRFPLMELNVKPQIIEIVPMSPPFIVSQPLRVPASVYIRPFVLAGGARSNPDGQIPGQGVVVKSGLPPHAVSPGEHSAAAARAAPADPGRVVGRESAAPVPDATGKKPKLTVNMDRVSQRLREKKTMAERAGQADFIAGQGIEALPFGDSPQRGDGGDSAAMGDGTSSHAFGGNAFFDSRGYDITPWAKRMIYRVKKNWLFPPVAAYGLKGVVGIYLLIRRDGAIGNIHVRKASGIRPFDQAAFNAIELCAPLPPLPDDFPHADLPVYLLFYYN